MPWCERCDRFLNPNTVNADGTCPSCGRQIEPLGEGSVRAPAADQPDGDAVAGDAVAGNAVAGEDDYKAPWHFWVMIAGVVLYLGWRLLEAIIWGWDRLF